MLSGIISLTLLVLFIAGSIWAYSPKRKAEFDEAARLAVDDISEKSKRQISGPITSSFWLR